MDEQHLYHWEALNDWDYSEEDWTETDDAQFADVSDFDDLELDPSPYLVGDNISKLPKEGRNNSEDLGQNITTFEDPESELSEPPEEEPLETNFGSIVNSRWSRRTWAPWIFYSGQVTYGSAPISKRLLEKPSQPNPNLATPETPSNLARFTNTRVAQSHVYMVQTLRMLESNVDNKGDDEPNTLKQAMHCSDWHKWKEVMQIEYDSLIKNKTWELTLMPENWQVIISRWCFKLKKDCNGQILKYKARWVVHGFKQEKGLDFVETFAAVVKPMSYKCLFGVSVKRGYKIWQMDVVTAFLYGFLDEIIYVK